MSLYLLTKTVRALRKQRKISIKNDALNEMNDSAANCVFLLFRYQVIQLSQLGINICI